MVSKLKICSTLMRVMNVGDSGPVGVAMQGCEFGQALLVRNKVRNLLNQQRHRVNKHRMNTGSKQENVFMISVLIRWAGDPKSADLRFRHVGTNGLRAQ